MEVPDWLVDEVLATANPTALRLAVMLVRHGTRVHGDGGEARVYWRGTKQQLARLAGASKPALAAAESELVARGVLKQHIPETKRDTYAVSLAIGKVCEESCPPFESGEAPIAVAVPDQPSSEEEIGSSSSSTSQPWTPEELADLQKRLRTTGARDAATWVRLYGGDRCDRALQILEAAGKRSEIRNPAGFVYRLLSNGKALPAPETPDESFEARKRRYTSRGPF